MAENKTLDIFNPPGNKGLTSGDGLQMDFTQAGKFCVISISGGHKWTDVFPSNDAPSGTRLAGYKWPGHGDYATCTLPGGANEVVITFETRGVNEDCPSTAGEIHERATEVTGHTITVGS